MTSTARLLLTLFISAVCWSCQTIDPMTFGTATLHGVVYDETRLPVDGVVIHVSAGDSVASDVNGRFALSDVPHGPIQFSATRGGYRTLHGEFDFGNRTHILYIRMESATVLRRAIETAMVTGDVDESFRLCEELLDIDATNPVSRYLAGIVFHLVGDTARANEQVVWLVGHSVRGAAIERLREAIAVGDGLSADVDQEGM